jgi:DNA-binding transcriptional ArsR family regulator
MISEASRSGPRGYDYVAAAELDRARVRVACSPLPTVFTLTRDALQKGRRGTPRTWRAAAISRLRRRDAAVLAPLTDPRCTGWPGLLEATDAPRETLDEALERVVSTPGAALLEAMEHDPDVSPADPLWDALHRDPDRWLRGYVDAVYRSWQGLEPLWRRSTGLLEREADRISAAAADGVPGSALVMDVSPPGRATLVNAQFRIPTTLQPRRLTVPADGVILAPMIAPEGSGMLSSPDDSLVRIAYAIPGAWRAFEDRTPPPASLEALVGMHRSRLLRRLDRPFAAGELAAALDLRPNAMTFHLRALEAAGLIVRERRGRHVMVHRTERGSVLLALYESA